jgi:4-hydroxy-tetrahydrodipicolinate reductase
MTRPILVMINGAFGKMGALACSSLEENPKFQIVSRLGRQDQLSEQIAKINPDVILDLTTAECIKANCEIYLNHQSRFVIGTSGLNADDIANIETRCLAKKQGALIVPNFSIAAILCMEFAQKSAKWFDNVDIIEMHHHLKKDSPSGTARHTATLIHQAKPDWPQMNQTPQAGRETFIEGIPIHSVRMHGILAMQQVMFGQLGETFTIAHQTIDRQAYAPGIALSCEVVMQLSHLVCGLSNFIN